MVSSSIAMRAIAALSSVAFLGSRFQPVNVYPGREGPAGIAPAPMLPPFRTNMAAYVVSTASKFLWNVTVYTRVHDAVSATSSSCIMKLEPADMIDPLLIGAPPALTVGGPLYIHPENMWSVRSRALAAVTVAFFLYCSVAGKAPAYPAPPL